MIDLKNLGWWVKRIQTDRNFLKSGSVCEVSGLAIFNRPEFDGLQKLVETLLAAGEIYACVLLYSPSSTTQGRAKLWLM
jgi:hypothetical protein